MSTAVANPSDMLSIYEREDEGREARTCPGCGVEEGSKRDNNDGRRTWWQWDCDDMKLKPCAVCRPAEDLRWLKDNPVRWFAINCALGKCAKLIHQAITAIGGEYSDDATYIKMAEELGFDSRDIPDLMRERYMAALCAS